MPRLKINLFGGLIVVLDGQPNNHFYSNKARALLGYLLLECNQLHPRDKLAGLLWPNSTDKQARHSLRQTLGHLRKMLGDRKNNPPFLLADRHVIGWNAECDYTTDVAVLDADSTLSQLAEGHAPLLDGLFLPDCLAFEEWLTVQREAARQRVLKAYEQQVATAAAAQAHEQVRAVAQQWLTLDPWQESAYRALMQAQAAAGDHAAALTTYESCRDVLLDVFGIEPTHETQTLYHQIRLDNVPFASNLPQYATPFIGRKSEITTIHQRLSKPNGRLLTLLGTGGSGKTRLAVEAARQQTTHALFVSLADLSPAKRSQQIEQQILQAIAQALPTLTVSGRKPLLDQLADHLQNRRLLLILDNFEHLRHGCGAIASLLERADLLQLLVTSRIPLKLSMEQLLPIDGLAQQGQDVEEVVDLFVACVRRKQPDYEISAENRPAIETLCQLLGGLPLAIELAAAWLPQLTPDEIVQELEQGLDILTSADYDAPARHRSLYAACNHSWRLLSAKEQQIFTQLAVWRGGFTVEAAKQIANVSPFSLMRLIDASMVQRDANGRYWLHEVLRQFALEKGDVQTGLASKHAAYYADLAGRLDPLLESADFIESMRQLSAEYDNITAALDWTVAYGTTDDALKFVLHLATFWETSCRFSEGRDWLGRVLDAAKGQQSLRRAAGLLKLAQLAQKQSDWEALRYLVAQADEIYAAQQDEVGQGHCKVLLAAVHFDHNEQLEARRLALAVLESAEKHEANELCIAAHNVLGRIAHARQELETGRTHFEAALALMTTWNNLRMRAIMLNNLATIYVHQQDFANAALLLNESISLREQMQDRRGVALASWNVGNMYHQQRMMSACREAYKRALSNLQALQDQRLVIILLGICATIPQVEGAYRAATMLLGASEALSERLQIPRWGHFLDHAHATTQQLKDAQSDLDFRTAWSRGERMSYNEAVAFALAV